MEPKTGTQLIAWAPFIVVIAAWIVFMTYLRLSPTMVQRRTWFGQTLNYLQRIEAQLENIVRRLDDKDRKELPREIG